MDLDAGDIDTLFALIDDGDGGITVDELIKGVSRLKGTARSRTRVERFYIQPSLALQGT
jgi:hypothetical protein